MHSTISGISVISFQGSAIMDYVLNVTASSWKRFLHTCRSEHASKAPGAHKPQERLWFSPAAQRGLCVPPGMLHFLFSQLTQQKKKAKIASISPYGLGLFCFGIYEHIPSSGWMRNRETSLWNVQAQPGQMGPFEIYDPAPRLTTLSTLLHWGKLPPVFLDKEGEQHFLT